MGKEILRKIPLMVLAFGLIPSVGLCQKNRDNGHKSHPAHERLLPFSEVSGEEFVFEQTSYPDLLLKSEGKRELDDCIRTCASHQGAVPSFDEFALFSEKIYDAFHADSKAQWINYCATNPSKAAISKLDFHVKGSEGYTGQVRSYTYFCAEDELNVHQYTELPNKNGEYAIYKGADTDTLIQAGFKKRQCFCIGLSPIN